MEREYYNTQNMASNSGSLSFPIGSHLQPAQQFFYGIGVGTCTIAFWWFYTNCYPVTTNRLVTDLAWAYCKAETKLNRFSKLLKTIVAPLTGLVPTAQPKDLFLYYKKDNDRYCFATNLDVFNVSQRETAEPCKYIEYTITDEHGSSVHKIFRDLDSIPKAHTCIELKPSEYRAFSIVLEGADDYNVDLYALLKNKNVMIVGNQIFDRLFLENTLEINNLPNEYTITIIDNKMNNIKLETNDKKKQWISVEEDNIVIISDITEDNSDDVVDNNGNSNTSKYWWWSNNSTKKEE